MTIATDLRAMRECIDAHGFSPFIDKHRPRTCFIGANKMMSGVLPYLQTFLGNDWSAFDSHVLMRDGWTQDDAIAVLEIAEACAIQEGV